MNCEFLLLWHGLILKKCAGIQSQNAVSLEVQDLIFINNNNYTLCHFCSAGCVFFLPHFFSAGQGRMWKSCPASISGLTIFYISWSWTIRIFNSSVRADFLIPKLWYTRISVIVMLCNMWPGAFSIIVSISKVIFIIWNDKSCFYNK